MKISIVTISYNQAKFLEQAIRSVIEQDYPNIEYIVVDPGSTDGSREIIERYSDLVDKIIFEPDSGPGDGLNRGFSQATGDVYGFLNSDDMLLPGALTKVAKVFSANKSSDVVCGHGYVVDERGDVVRRIYSDKFNLMLSAYGACILVQPSTFFKADIFRRSGGFNAGNRSNWDSELFIDMALSNAEFLKIDEMLSAYRIHPESITGSAKLRHLHSAHRNRMFQKIFCRKPNNFDSILSSIAVYVRKFRNPRDTYERIIRGPVFGLSSR